MMQQHVCHTSVFCSDIQHDATVAPLDIDATGDSGFLLSQAFISPDVHNLNTCKSGGIYSGVCMHAMAM